MLVAPRLQAILPLAAAWLEQKAAPGARRKRETAQADGLPISSSGTHAGGEADSDKDAPHLAGSAAG